MQFNKNYKQISGRRRNLEDKGKGRNGEIEKESEIRKKKISKRLHQFIYAYAFSTSKEKYNNDTGIKKEKE
jgi:hypothetical protein